MGKLDQRRVKACVESTARWNDKSGSCTIHTAGQLAEYIEEEGFLPFFKNDTRGFSLEEHTLPGDWNGGNPQAGAWEWRSAAVRSGRAVYGNFFAGKEGFISQKWFPCFANYRRCGCDFDALWDDGKADRKYYGSGIRKGCLTGTSGNGGGFQPHVQVSSMQERWGAAASFVACPACGGA